MAEQNRNPREIETRTTSLRPTAWKLPDLLPEPDKQAGFDYRWVRTMYNDKYDARNISLKFREGWEPVKVEEQPKYSFLTDPDSRFKDAIEIGGLLLCKIPTEFVHARFAYEANLTKANSDAVDNSFLRESDSRMPLFQEKKSEVSFGNRK